MKNKWLNIICGVFILASLIVIAWSLISISEKQSNGSRRFVNISKLNDPLTEVTFDEVLFDVGKITVDSTIRQRYSFINSGIYPLIVYYIDPDCNCTNYEISKNIAMPNDSIIITLTIDMKDKRQGIFMLNSVVQLNTKKQFYLLRLIGDVVER